MLRPGWHDVVFANPDRFVPYMTLLTWNIGRRGIALALLIDTSVLVDYHRGGRGTPLTSSAFSRRTTRFRSRMRSPGCTRSRGSRSRSWRRSALAKALCRPVEVGEEQQHESAA